MALVLHGALKLSGIRVYPLWTALGKVLGLPWALFGIPSRSPGYLPGSEAPGPDSQDPRPEPVEGAMMPGYVCTTTVLEPPPEGSCVTSAQHMVDDGATSGP